MATIIKLTPDFNPQSYPSYFFDANIWIAAIVGGSKDKNVISYVNLFEAILALNNQPENIKKKIKVLPKIRINSVFLSEIINTYLRKIAFSSFMNGSPGNFKTDYRNNHHSDYDKQLKNIISEIKARESAYIFEKDDFDINLFNDTTSNLSRSIDFNDYFYYSLMKKNNTPIVTHDSDFNSLNDITLIKT